MSLLLWKPPPRGSLGCRGPLGFEKQHLKEGAVEIAQDLEPQASLELCVHHRAALWPWACYLKSVTLLLLTCKVGAVAVLRGLNEIMLYKAAPDKVSSVFLPPLSEL